MGYFVETTGIDFTIPKENLDDAYRAMCELNRDDSKKEGGYFGGKPEDISGSTSVSTSPDKWFSWMSWDYDVECENAAEIFSMLGFEVDENEDGSLSLIRYDNKTGQEALFLEAVAPYVQPGSFINWVGEDGFFFCHEFDGETMKVKYG